MNAQHNAVLSRPAHLLRPDERPETGPIAILPASERVYFFASAVAAAGGRVSTLDDATRGLIWLSSRHAEELDRILSDHPGIGWVQLPWAGVDAVTAVIAAHPEVLWTSAKGSYAEPVAEHALMLLLALLRDIPVRLRAKSWDQRSSGRSLYGREVVIIGAGGIALELVRLLEVFRVRVTVVRRSDDPVAGATRTVTSDRLHEALTTADAIVVAAASTSSTKHLLGASEFALLPAGAVVVNIARGALIDTDALIAALESGHLGGAGVDVTDPEPLPDGHPLWSAPNCIITPHTADTPEMTTPLLADRIRRNTSAFVASEGEPAEFVGVVDPAAGY